MAGLKVPPPDIAGFEYVRHIGSGGYSEVFEYRDDLGRRVAVKVLTEETSDSEARAMAAVSVHSAIVDVFKTDLTPGGLRYLVMPYFGGPSFAELLRQGPIAVDEVLSVGVQVAGALEFAHQNGILHRDVKPANILTNDLGRPALSDFGIASRHDTGDRQRAVSLPWAPPEVLEERMPDPRSDVYALAATLYTLLAGHPPFVVAGGDNSDTALTGRTVSADPPPLTRRDVPASLDGLLRWAMSRDPRKRPESAEAFGRGLQAVESELGLSVTRLEVAGRLLRGRVEPGAHAPQPEVRDDDATVARSVRVIRADGDGELDDRTRSRDSSVAGLIDSVPARPNPSSGRRRPLLDLKLSPSIPPVEETRGRSVDEPEVATAAGAPSARRWIVPVVVATALGMGVVLWAMIGDESGGGGTTTTACVALVGCGRDEPTLPRVRNLTLVRIGEATVRAEWTPPEDDRVVRYVYRRCEPDGDGQSEYTTDHVVELGAPAGKVVCVEVASEDAEGVQSAPVQEVLE